MSNQLWKSLPNLQLFSPVPVKRSKFLRRRSQNLESEIHQSSSKPTKISVKKKAMLQWFFQVEYENISCFGQWTVKNSSKGGYWYEAVPKCSCSGLQVCRVIFQLNRRGQQLILITGGDD